MCIKKIIFSGKKDLNLWSPVPKTDALNQTMLFPVIYFIIILMMVGFEPTTLGL
jgi:hypothetical protein